MKPDKEYQELLVLAELALVRLKARRNENIEEWARKLAKDLSKFTD